MSIFNLMRPTIKNVSILIGISFFLFLLTNLYWMFVIRQADKYSKSLIFLGTVGVSIYRFVLYLIWIYVFSYLLIFLLNKWFNEIQSFNIVRSELRNYCFIVALIPSIIESIIVIFYMLINPSNNVPSIFLVIIAFGVTGILLFLLLTFKYPTKLIKYIIPIIFFIAQMFRRFVLIGYK